ASSLARHLRPAGPQPARGRGPVGRAGDARRGRRARRPARVPRRAHGPAPAARGLRCGERSGGRRPRRRGAVARRAHRRGVRRPAVAGRHRVAGPGALGCPARPREPGRRADDRWAGRAGGRGGGRTPRRGCDARRRAGRRAGRLARPPGRAARPRPPHRDPLDARVGGAGEPDHGADPARHRRARRGERGHGAQPDAHDPPEAGCLLPAHRRRCVPADARPAAGGRVV
ncbi:MAG: hypothetical protein AVDCRST_MAG06-2143, partial [uncultured Nocardioides sp.]